MKLPLEGIRVLDWTHWQQGPVAAMMLGDLGADVIKIEQRVTGDPFRGLIVADGGNDLNVGPGRGCYYECLNRNKRGIALDLKKEEGRKIVRGLAETADVFVHNFRKGVPQKLGLDYESLSSHNPKLIYANCSGFGPQGPASHDPAYDYLAMARSGIMTTGGNDPDTPVPPGAGLADQMGGTMAAYGILAALLARERLGVGQELDASLMSSMIWLQFLNVNSSLMVGYTHRCPPRGQGARNPLVYHYRCADGYWIALSLLQADRYWTDFCKVAGIEDLKKDPRFENMTVRALHSPEMEAILDRIFATKTREEWIGLFRKADLIVAPLNTISDLGNDAQVTANDYVIEYDHPVLGRTIKMVGMPVELKQTPGSIRRPAPELGEHTEEILLEAGYGWDEISALKEQEVI